MGPLFVAMPRTNYRGAFSNDAGGPSTSSSPNGAAAAAASSKLIGGDDEEEEMTARQISSRISQKLGIPIFVSCCFSSGSGGNAVPQLASEGIDQNMVQQRAAAIAEKEICRILQEKLK